MSTILGLFFAVCIGLLSFVVYKPRNLIPSHMLGHNVVDRPHFFSPDTTLALLDFVRSFQTIPSSQRDAEFTKPSREDIGEATDMPCTNPFLLPNRNRTKCVFPGRIDVGRHYIRSGGSEGAKETYETATSRLQSFLLYLFDWEKYKITKTLLEDAAFIELGKSVCPSPTDVLDPFQLNLIAQVPGQTVATHIDGAYFWGATRFDFPQWLLAAMVFSGLFEKSFIHQVQIVGYFHQWEDSTRGGDFLFWNTSSDKPLLARPTSRSANAVDGSKTVHSAGVYMAGERPPLMPPTSLNDLVYNGDGTWSITSDGKVLRTYSEDMLRFSVVYRARCFPNEAERARYHAQTKSDVMSLESILSVFQRDLKERGIRSDFEGISPYDMGILILDTYITYPYSPTAILPYNYCALPRLMPWTAWLLSPICP